MADVTIIAAFLAGLASFLAPCILPLAPAFISYLGGVSGAEAGGAGAKWKVFLNSVFFVLGFSLVFSALGVLLNGAFSFASPFLTMWVSRLAGLLMIAFGLSLLGIIRLGFLEKERRLSPVKVRYSYITSFSFGASFAAGWTPCVGVLLGSVLALSLTQPGNAFTLLLAYSAGLAVPFLLVGALTAQAGGFIARNAKALSLFNNAMGFVLIALGALALTGNLSRVASLALSGS